jgi:hypothetical protein
MPPQYKFVEVSPVTEETLEAAVNEWVGRGWQLESIRFVVTEHSRRPQLAYISFVTSLGPPLAASPDRLGQGLGPPVTSVTDAPGAAQRPVEQPASVIAADHEDEVE